MVPEDIQGVFVCNRGKLDGAAFDGLVCIWFGRRAGWHIHGSVGIRFLIRAGRASQEEAGISKPEVSGDNMICKKHNKEYNTFLSSCPECNGENRTVCNRCANNGKVCDTCDLPEGWSFPTRFCEEVSKISFPGGRNNC